MGRSAAGFVAIWVGLSAGAQGAPGEREYVVTIRPSASMDDAGAMAESIAQTHGGPGPGTAIGGIAGGIGGGIVGAILGEKAADNVYQATVEEEP